MRMLRTIDAAAVVVKEGRQRQSFDETAHQELITSISEKGLYHAIVAREVGGEVHLVAGERRLRAMREMVELGECIRYDGGVLPHGKIPYVSLGDLSPLEAKEAELEENIRRADLTWEERVRAEAELVDLRQKQAEAKGVPFDMQAVVKEIKGPDTSSAYLVQRSVVLAKNLHRPEVAKAKSQKEAWKILMQEHAKEENEKMAAALGESHISSRHTLVVDNCIAWLGRYDGPPFSVILTDPPYGMGADEFGDSGKEGLGGHEYVDSAENFASLMDDFIPAITRVAAADAHLYLFCDIEKFESLSWLLTEQGWKVFRTPLIWYKPSGFRAPWPEHGPQRKYETILYARRGERKCNYLAGDVIECLPDSNLGHVAQKPVALYSELLARSAHAGDLVLDPFCGSGPIFEAAQARACIATGVELCLNYAGIATKRLAAIKEQTK